MTATPSTPASIGYPSPGDSATRSGPAYQAYRLLQFAFVVAPIVAGADKFFNKLTNWNQYLSPTFVGLAHEHKHGLMLTVGVIEIIAGLGVLVLPRIFAYVVALWLLGIIVNLILVPGYYDIALRDLGLCLGALALGRLSGIFAVKRV